MILIGLVFFNVHEMFSKFLFAQSDRVFMIEMAPKVSLSMSLTGPIALISLVPRYYAQGERLWSEGGKCVN